MIKKRGKGKGAFFFSMDALIALSIILIIVGIAIPVISYSKKDSKVQGDILAVISTLTVGEMCAAHAYPAESCIVGPQQCQNPANPNYIRCVENPLPNDLNNTILEQIGKFYIEESDDYDTILGEKILESVPGSANVGIWLIDGNKEISIANKSNKNYSHEDLRDIEVANYLVSGVDLSSVGGSFRGYSAFSYLQKALRTKYFYFGGYVGDGNLTSNITYNGEIKYAVLEVAINNNFTVWVNGVNTGTNYKNSPSLFEPARYSIKIDDFNSGTNLVELKSINSTNLYVAGGYLKITYNASDNYIESDTYHFPGIDGYINLYDSFYVPGDLKGMDLYLNFRSELATIFSIGNVTIVNQTLETPTSGDNYEISVPNATIKTILDPAGLTWEDLSKKTIPIRFGFENSSAKLPDVDIVFLIDTTYSMFTEINATKNIVINFTKKLEENSLSYRLGLIDFRDYYVRWELCGASVDYPYKVHIFDEGNFTTNATEFRDEIAVLGLGSGLDTPESHLSAINESLYNLSWKNENKRYEIMLTDAPPHAKDCFLDASCTTTTYAACYFGPEYMKNMSDALVESQVTFYRVINGSQASSVCFNDSMHNLSSATGGKSYNYTNAQDVEDVLLEISEDIIRTAYANQTVTIDDPDFNSTLYPNSSIKFYYDKDIYNGTLLDAEISVINEYYGEFTLPDNSQLVETRLISYSGPRWTDRLSINNQEVYNLSKYISLDINDYYISFIKLGDPYPIHIPNEKVDLTNLNKVDFGTQTVPYQTDPHPGSKSNKIIYTIIKNITSLTDIMQYSDGCNWTIQFEDEEPTSQIDIPKGYLGPNKCYYQNVTYNGGQGSYTNVSINNTKDAQQVAVYNLLKQLDFDGNGEVDIKFLSESFELGVSDVEGVPYAKSAIVQVRKWY